ncbi:hypothetical protein S7335_5505 [Synechococcus sp. PCC 7335]|nr:hypothetical protein S7335_5505 [Synechococcus sp. PCC 7335]
MPNLQLLLSDQRAWSALASLGLSSILLLSRLLLSRFGR